MATTARDFLADRGYRAEPIYLTDLDRVSPASALAPDLRPNTWQTLPYETEDRHGVLLWAGFESQSPAVTYPMDRRGWHAICVGFHPTTEDQGWLGQVLVKLSGDDTYSMLRWDGPQGLDGHTRRQRFEELFWRVAKLDGQDLVFEQIARRVAAGDGPGTIQGDAAKIAYVKLVPLSDAEAAAHERDLRDASIAPAVWAQRRVLSLHLPHHDCRADPARGGALPGDGLWAYLLGGWRRRQALLPHHRWSQSG